MTTVRLEMKALLLFSAVMACGIVRNVSAAYCDDNLFPEEREDEQQQQRRSSGVQFTKELSTTEYGSLSSFKTLHCCGKKYLSIEWFKDNRPYPWPGDVSSFILNPESANQTIYTRSLTSSDHGLYTCQLSNQTNVINHSINLVTIDDTSYWGDPLPTYKIPKEHYAQPGDSVRLYCEAFVGKVNLPDAVNTITWHKIGENNHMIESNEKYTIDKVVRENDQVLGEFLFINNIQKTDFGQFMCSVSNADDQIVEQFTNITKPKHVFNNEKFDKKVHKDLKLIIFIMLTLILIVWKRRWFYLVYQMLKKKVKNDKYVLPEKQVHTVIVLYDEENKEKAQKLMETLENRDIFLTKQCQIDFVEDFIKMHAELVKGYDVALYLLSSNDVITSLTTKPVQTPFIRDNRSSPKKYIIDCGNMPVTPTELWCDIVVADLNNEYQQRNKNSGNKLIRIV